MTTFFFDPESILLYLRIPFPRRRRPQEVEVMMTAETDDKKKLPTTDNLT